jgi:hypothetical protein
VAFLVLPFREAIATGEGYYIVWPKNSLRKQSIERLLGWLNLNTPVVPSLDIVCLDWDYKGRTETGYSLRSILSVSIIYA